MYTQLNTITEVIAYLLDYQMKFTRKLVQFVSQSDIILTNLYLLNITFFLFDISIHCFFYCNMIWLWVLLKQKLFEIIANRSTFKLNLISTQTLILLQRLMTQLAYKNCISKAVFELKFSIEILIEVQNLMKIIHQIITVALQPSEISFKEQIESSANYELLKKNMPLLINNSLGRFYFKVFITVVKGRNLSMNKDKVNSRIHILSLHLQFDLLIIGLFLDRLQHENFILQQIDQVQVDIVYMLSFDLLLLCFKI
ncbi:unnamed protein product [Paramecium octaurelia]|uniref:Transmembrane protein n=1 Tax=Paramecium octaurelia TaxID=43137 RepID=A0A8S1WDL8_PAROT|nr:unnamed protein product [Paramecium octaurelia]